MIYLPGCKFRQQLQGDERGIFESPRFGILQNSETKRSYYLYCCYYIVVHDARGIARSYARVNARHDPRKPRHYWLRHAR